RLRQGVEIDDAIDAIVAVLQRDELLDRAEIVAEVQVAARLHAGKYAMFERHGSALVPAGPMPRPGLATQGESAMAATVLAGLRRLELLATCRPLYCAPPSAPAPPRAASIPREPKSMPAPRFDVLGIGNAIVDVLARTEDDFLIRHNMRKGAMALIDEERAAS